MNVKDQFASAESALKKGRVKAAVDILKSIIKNQPDEPNSLRLLGLIAMGQKDYKASIEFLEQACRSAPNFVHAQLDYGRALFFSGSFEEASKILSRICDQEPSTESFQMLGNVQAGLGRREDAVSSFKKSIELDPFRGQISSGVKALGDKDSVRAEKIFREVLKHSSDHIHALIGLASVALDAGAVKDAKKLLNHALKISPNTESIWRGLARAYSESAQYVEAREAAERAVELAPEVADGWTMLGTVLAGALEPEKARDAFAKALQLKPMQPRVLLSMGHVEKTIGDSRASERAYDEAFKIDPSLGEAMWSKADLKTYRFRPDEIEAMNHQLGKEISNASDVAAFHFALGKAHEDDQAYELSFSHYQSGNRIKAEIEPFPMEEFKSRNKQIRMAFSSPPRSVEGASESPTPIFILGMPRAGSTLLEQILASHSLVEGTMELPQILNFTRDIESRKGGYKLLFGEEGPEIADNFAKRYLEETETFRSGKPYFIDKMPNNFPHIGFIAHVMPNAVFVDARRNPMDCCLSAFKQNFARGQSFSYGLEVVGDYYQEYRAMMNHWHSVMPGRVIEVNYESIVNNLEDEVRRLLDHCGLVFERGCVDFHKTKRSVRTASAQQVRQPIYKSGVEHWRNYETWLEPLKDALAHKD